MPPQQDQNGCNEQKKFKRKRLDQILKKIVNNNNNPLDPFDGESLKTESYQEDVSSDSCPREIQYDVAMPEQDEPIDLSMHHSKRMQPLFDCERLQNPWNLAIPLPPAHPISPPTHFGGVVEQITTEHLILHPCLYCEQVFSLRDRLAKHVASRHRAMRCPDQRPPSAKIYECEICTRRFARSDMLTRHIRLHTGDKPYACMVCQQVFTRSDHLATHQRTHTGEKPYKCPLCSYAACRRDMITRHTRTHFT